MGCASRAALASLLLALLLATARACGACAAGPEGQTATPMPNAQLPSAAGNASNTTQPAPANATGAAAQQTAGGGGAKAAPAPGSGPEPAQFEAAEAGPVPGKETWPELVGRPAAAAQRTIQRERPDLTVQVVPAGTAVTMEYREDRVRIFADESPRVAQVPSIG